MKILISGAGIGSLTLAYWLQRSGHQPIIVEKALDIRPTGYIIDFAGTGWEVANRMNIIPQLEARSYPMTSSVSAVRKTLRPLLCRAPNSASG